MIDKTERIALIKKIVTELSKVFPNVKYDKETIAIWGRILKGYDGESITRAKESLIRNHSGYLYPSEFIKVLKGITRESVKHEKKITVHPNSKKRIQTLLNDLKCNG